MKIVKRTFLAAILFSCSSHGIFAADGKTLVVELRNGSTTSYLLAQNPEISFSNHAMNVSLAGSNSNLELSQINQFYFVGTSDGIELTQSDNISITYVSAEEIIVRGLKTKDHITVYAVNGASFNGCITRSVGQAEISLKNLPQGIYIIDISDKQTFKIHKR